MRNVLATCAAPASSTLSQGSKTIKRSRLCKGSCRPTASPTDYKMENCLQCYPFYPNNLDLRAEIHRLFCGSKDVPKYRGWDIVSPDSTEDQNSLYQQKFARATEDKWRAGTFTLLKAKPRKKGKCCAFCKENGSPEHYYRSHLLKDSNSGQVICPIMRKHVCELCGATGDLAHTRSYCNKYPGHQNMAQLKKTKMCASGLRKPQFA